MKRILLIAGLLVAAWFANGCTTTYDYDPATGGSADGTRTRRVKTSSQFVRGIYADLIGRAPTDYDFVLEINGTQVIKLPLQEEPMLVGTLEGVGDSQPMRNLLVAGLLHSTEVSIPDKSAVADPRTYIHDQFTRLLGREPNVYELEAFASAWQSDPAVGPRTIIRAITGSREYQSQ